ncbi:MAG TPA: DUF4258 domain-containing protein [Desulfuromonadales bacterium]|nr:DUF4258 domain-containing protein [Desulfuromonadales bacterium]
MKSYQKLIFRLHALSRMAQRGFEPGEIRNSLEHGRVVEEYPEDFPYPNFLMMLWLGQRPVHVVAANNDDDSETIIITVYEPDPLKWNSDFTRRTS